VAVTYRTVANLASDGPLLLGPNPAADVNQAVLRAESGLREGAYVVLQVDSVQAASQVIASLNSQYQQGQIRYPNTGELIRGWPEYPGRIAFPFNAGNGIELRWIKGQPWVFVLVLAMVVVAALVVLSLQRSPYRMQTPAQGQGAGGGGGGVGLKTGPFIWFGVGPDGTFRVLDLPWYWAVAGAAGLAVAPLAIESVARLDRSRADLIEGERRLRTVEGE